MDSVAPPAATFSVIFVVLFILQNILRVLSAACSLSIWFVIPVSKNEREKASLNTTVSLLSDLVLSIATIITNFLAQIVASVISSIYILFPFLVVCVMLSVANNQYDFVVRGFMTAYNSFIAQNSIVVVARHTLWFVKLFWEMCIPMYNYIVHVTLSINVEVLKALFSESDTRNVVFSIFSGIGTSTAQFSTAMAAWFHKDVFGCRYSAIAESMTIDDEHPCMQLGPSKYRTLELHAVVRSLQVVVAQSTLLVVALCPALTSFTTALVYPVYDEHMPDIVENLVNLGIGGVWTVWDVTHSRCNYALKNKLPSTLCMPDVGPLFHFVHQIVLDVGDLADNWANVANVIIMKFFMERDPQHCSKGKYNVRSMTPDALFGNNNTRIVALTSSLIATTDGSNVVFSSVRGSAETQVRPMAFLPSIDLRFGVAGIEYGNSAQHADMHGDTTTALMGCVCADTPAGALIQCHVVEYDTNHDPRTPENSRKRIDVVFQGSGTSNLMRCDRLRISVQPVRFPKRQYDFMPTGFYGGRPSAARGPMLDCLVDPQKCNNVDAIIHVAPVCTVGGGLTRACVAELKDNFCYPYCVGLHQRRTGSFPITLYNEESMSTGVYMTNMDCANDFDTTKQASLFTPFATETSSLTAADISGDNIVRARLEDKGRCVSSSIHVSMLISTNTSACSGNADLCLGRRIASHPRVFFAHLQPAVVAGDVMLVPQCSAEVQDGKDCEWTVSLMRLTSDIQGQYSIQPQLVDIPAMRSLPEKTTKTDRIILPSRTMDYQRWYNPAAQTATGVVYSMNPDLQFIVALLRQSGSQIAVRDNFKTARVYMTEPTYQCALTANVQLATGVRVKRCNGNLTREILFTGEDRFWSYDDNLPDAFRERRVFNLFVEDVQHIDSLNVAVVVRRGPLKDLLYEAEIDPRPAGYENMGASVYYFVNTITLEVRKGEMWAKITDTGPEIGYGALCPGDNVLPPFASMIASFTTVWVKAAEIIVNQLVFNIVGVLESMASSRAAEGQLCVKGSQSHYAFTPCDPGPLSIQPVYRAFLGFHTKIRMCAKASLGYVSYVIDMPLSENDWSQGGVYAFTPPNLQFTVAILSAFRASLVSGVSIAASAGISSFYGVAFLYEHIALPYVKKVMAIKYSANSRENFVVIFYTLSNTVYEAVASNAMDSTFLLPAEESCLSLAMLTGDRVRPLGQFVHHSCLALFEGVKAATRLVPSIFSLSSTAICICGQDLPVMSWASVLDTPGACQKMLPSALRAKYFEILNDGDRSTAVRADNCRSVIADMKVVLEQIPEPMLRQLTSAAVASSGIPQQLMSIFNIPGLQQWSCAGYNTGLGVIAIIPQPLHTFKSCAYTRTCRMICSESIDWFIAEKTNSFVTTKPPTTGSVRMGIPMPDRAPEERDYLPLMAHEYLRVQGCRRWIAVLGQTLRQPDETKAGYQMEFICQSSFDTAVLEIVHSHTTPLPTLAALNFDFGASADNNDPFLQPDTTPRKTVHEMWFAPLDRTDDRVVAVLLIAASVDDSHDGIYEIVVRSNGLMPSAAWISVSSSYVNPYTLCPQILQSIAQVLTVPPLVLEPSAPSEVKPIRYHKILMAPHGQERPGYTLHAATRGYVLNTESMRESRFTAIFTLVRHWDKPGVELTCTASVYNPIVKGTLSAYIEYEMISRALFLDSREQLLSIGVSKSFTAMYHHIALELDPLSETNTLMLHSNGSVPCGEGFENLHVATRNRRMKYSAMPMSPRKHISNVLAQSLSTGRGVFSTLVTSTLRPTNVDGWLEQILIDASTDADAAQLRTGPYVSSALSSGVLLQAQVMLTLGEEMPASFARTCDYMDCSGCSTLELQRSCYQAQRCALTRCVGTLVDTNNVMCVVGSLADKLASILVFQGREVWLLSVEVLIGILRKWSLGMISPREASRTPVDIEGVSSLFVQQKCDAKDLLATLSALIPSLFYTIYVGVLGGDASGRGSAVDRAFFVVRNTISPMAKLQTTEMIVAVTQLIFQFSLITVNVAYNFVRITLCLVDEMTSFTSGHINLVMNTMGEDDFCMANEDTEFPSSIETDEQMLQRIVMLGSLSSKGTHVRLQTAPSLGMQAYVTTAAKMIVWKKKMPRIMMIALLSTGMDWVIGITYGIARILVAAEDEMCKPRPAYPEKVVHCVCGDDEYEVSIERQQHLAVDGGLWCSGVLRMVNINGELVYVANEFSFHALKTALDPLMREYLMCISQKPSSECSIAKYHIDRINENNFARNDVSAINVLTLCRENYAARTWDEGLFAVYNEEIKASVLAAGLIPVEVMKSIKADTDVFLGEAVRECLRRGPEFNSIEQCMSLHFALENARTSLGRYAMSVKQNANSVAAVTPQAPAALNRVEYFVYSKRDTPHSTGADACKWASSSALQSEVLRRCASHDQQCAHGALSNPTTCSLNMVQETASRSGTSNPVAMFLVEDKHIVYTQEAILKRFQQVSECALGFFDDFYAKLIQSQTLDGLEYDLLSFEGDLLHQYVDCVIIGPESSLKLLPSLDAMDLEQMNYSRLDEGAIDGEPCASQVITDTVNGVVVNQDARMCGTGPRIAALSYITRDLINDVKTVKVMKNLILERVGHIKKTIANVSLFGCTNTVTNFTAQGPCSDGLFPDDLTARLDTLISTADIFAALFVVNSIQNTSLHSIDMWTKYKTDAFQRNVSHYDSMIPVLRSKKVSFPVNSILDDSDDTFSFPFARPPGLKLNFMEQCHGLLRAKVLSATLEDHNSESQGEHMLTIPVLKTWLARGVQWTPLNKDESDPLEGSISRADMIHKLKISGERDNALSVLYDARFVPLRSLFCTNANRSSVSGRSMNVNYALPGNKKTPFTGDQDVTRSIGIHGMRGRVVGDASLACPCHPMRNGLCEISRAVCAQGVDVLISRVPAFAVIHADFICEMGSSLLVSYATRHAPVMREVLAAFSEELKYDPMFICPLFNVSDHWGFMPLAERAQVDKSYFNESVQSLRTGYMNLLMHTRSGVTLSNIASVNRKIHGAMGEGDRVLHWARPDDPEDTRVDNVLCHDGSDDSFDALYHEKIARLAFPAVSMIAESPVVMDCIRYVIEVAWLDILDETTGIRTFEDLPRIRAISEENIELWQERCSIKLQKLQTCELQGAYTPLHVMRGEGDCPFEGDGVNIILLPTPCLVRHKNKMYDARICANLTTVHESIFGLGNLVAECEVLNPLSLLKGTSEAALSDTPLLSRSFVNDIIGVSSSAGARARGVLGLRHGEDFLFPSEEHHNAEAQCFQSIPYWPAAWQAPFGEIVSDNYDHGTGFSNHMMLLCNSDDEPCEKVVLAPDHLRDENMTSNLLGTGGLCREHSFAMPMLHTNTHTVCTERGETQSINEVTHIDTANDEKLCAKSSYASAEGSQRVSAGNLWPFMRFVVDQSGAHDATYSVDNDAILKILEHIESDGNTTSAYDIMPRLDSGEDLPSVLRDLCKTSDNYEIVPVEHDAATLGSPGECHRNSGCQTQKSEICTSAGKCATVTLQVENSNPYPVELGVSVEEATSCTSDNAKPRASPWEQYASFLEQHGLCSHSNAISFERASEAMQDARMCAGSAANNQRTAAETLQCSRNQEWDWMTQIPWSWRGEGSGANIDLQAYTQTVRMAAAFELEHHKCDSEFMQSRDPGGLNGLHMCSLRHRARSSYEYWMRASATVDDFSTMKNRKDNAAKCFNAYGGGVNACDLPGLQSDNHFTSEKMRFMGLRGEDVNFVADDSRKRLLQKCSDYGVCQSQFFTFGGVPTYRRNSNLSPPQPWSILSIEHCGAMGYLASTNPIQPTVREGEQQCFIDTHIAILPRMLIKHQGGACNDLYAANWEDVFAWGRTVSGSDVQFSYLKKNRASVMEHLNGLFWMEPNVLNAMHHNNRHTRYMLMHKCAENIQAELASMALGANSYATLNTAGKTSGLYYFFEFGTYEVALLWWLKYITQEHALRPGRTREVNVAEFLPENPYPTKLDAFDKRASQIPLHDAWTTDKVPLHALWARANTDTIINHANMSTILSKSLGMQLQEKLAAENEIFRIMCPRKLTMSQRPYTPDPSATASQQQRAGVPEADTCVPFQSQSEEIIAKRDVYVTGSGVNAGSRNSLHSQYEKTLVAARLSVDSAAPSCATPYAFKDNDMEEMVPGPTESEAMIEFMVFDDLISSSKDMLTVYDPFDAEMATKTQAEFVEMGWEGIPVAQIVFDKNEMENMVRRNIHNIMTTMMLTLDEEKSGKHRCKASKALLKTKAGDDLLTAGVGACLYDRHNLPSMKAEGVIRNWIKDDATVDLYTDGSRPLQQVHICQRDSDKAFRGKSHPDRQDGMSCSIYDAQEPLRGLDCSNCKSAQFATLEGSPCHLCDRASETHGSIDIPGANDEDAEGQCRLNNGPDFDMHGRYRVFDKSGGSAPRVFTVGGSYVFNADMYRTSPVTHDTQKRSPKSICHRIDSGCVTRKGSGVKKLFQYDGKDLPENMHPADAANLRVRRNAFNQVSIPRLEDPDVFISQAMLDDIDVVKQRDLDHWWKRDTQLYDLDGTQNPAFLNKYDPAANSQHRLWRNKASDTRRGMQCNVRKVAAPRIVTLKTFTLNKFGGQVSVDYAQMVFSDRMLFTRNHGTQLLFGHHFGRGAKEDLQQNTMGAPAASFCGHTPEHPALHWFRVEDFSVPAKKRFPSKTYTWDQNMGLKSKKDGLERFNEQITCADSVGVPMFSDNPLCQRPSGDQLYSCSDYKESNPPASGPPCTYCNAGTSSQSLIDSTCGSYLDTSDCGRAVCCGAPLPSLDMSDEIWRRMAKYCPSPVPGLATPFDNKGRCMPMDPIRYSLATKTCKCYQEPTARLDLDFRRQCDQQSRKQHDSMLNKQWITNKNLPPDYINKENSDKIVRMSDGLLLSVTKAWLDFPTLTEPDVSADKCARNVVYPKKLDKGCMNTKNRADADETRYNFWPECVEMIPFTYWDKDKAPSGAFAPSKMAVPGACSVLNSNHASPYKIEYASAGDYRHSTCQIPSPAGMQASEGDRITTAFDIYGLSVCWEQDVYETATLHPWWSLSISEMMSNFMDQSTNMHALKYWMGLAVPSAFSMREFMYPYRNEDNVNDVFQSADTSFHSIGTQWRPDKNCWLGQGAPGLEWKVSANFVNNYYCDVKDRSGIKDVDANFNSKHRIRWSNVQDLFDVIKLVDAGWNNVKKVVKHQGFNRVLDGIMQSVRAPVINKVMGRHLWYDGATDPYNSKSSRPMRFAPCMPGFTEADNLELKNSQFEHLQPALKHWDTRQYGRKGGDKKRYITKPTQWAEMDGSPGAYLVPCHPECEVDSSTPGTRKLKNPPGKDLKCGECKLLLQETVGLPTSVNSDAQTEWSTQETEGACSYSVELGADHFCSSLQPTAFESDAKLCPAAQFSFYPVWGKEPLSSSSVDNGAIFQCAQCRKYSLETPVLDRAYRDQSDATSKVGNYFDRTCVGCGLYHSSNDINWRGPYTSAAADLDNLSSKLVKHIWDVISSTALVDKLNAHFSQDSVNNNLKVKSTMVGDARSIHIYLDRGRVHPMNTAITDQFRTFGSAKSTADLRGGEGCQLSDTTSTAFCGMSSGFSSGKTFDKSLLVKESIIKACSEVPGVGEPDGQNTCLDAIAGDEHLQRLKDYAENQMRRTYGKRMPYLDAIHDENDRLIAQIAPITILDFDGDHIDWTQGILPFYAKSHRREEDQYVRSLLDHERNCRDETDLNFDISSRPCIKDSQDRVGVVNPWLGGNYSVYTAFHTLQQADAFMALYDQKTLMGFDMCNVDDTARSSDQSQLFKRIPCAAKMCLDYVENSTLSANSNMTVCRYSSALNKGVEDELPSFGEMLRLASIIDPRFVYTARPQRDVCGRMFVRKEGTSTTPDQCDHPQSPLGYNPAQIRKVEGHTVGLGGYNVMKPGKIVRDMFTSSSVSGMEHSLWAGRDAVHSFVHRSPEPLVADTDAPMYAKLAADPEQLAPDFIGLKIDERGFMFVNQLGLNGRASEVEPDQTFWPRTLADGIRLDAASIAANPLYSNPCSGSCSWQHWSCPYIHHGLYGGSAGLQREHPSVHFITPDPTRMGRLYPGKALLRRTHPLLRSRRVSPREINQFAQYGPALFFPRNKRYCPFIQAGVIAAAMKLHVQTLIRNTAFSLISNSQTIPCVQPGRLDKMDWPWMPAVLRSDEPYTGGSHRNLSHTPHTLCEKMDARKFRIWVSTKNDITKEQVPDHVTTYNKHTHTTLDQGGDCHRDHLVRVSSAELEALRNYEKCYVIERNAFSRTLRCERSVGFRPSSETGTGVKDELTQVFVLNVSRTSAQTLHGRTGLQNSDAGQYRLCKYHHNAEADVPTVFFGSESDTTMPESEISISRRVRVSPLWTLIQQRARGTDVAARFAMVNGLTIKRLWDDTSARRQGNVRWAVAAPDAKASSNSTEWLAASLAGAVHCEGLQEFLIGRYSREWREGKRRDENCLALPAVIREYRVANKCALAAHDSEPFDICSIAELDSFCAVLGTFRLQVASVNAWASEQTEHTAMLYTPSVFERGDAQFVWSAVSQSYTSMQLLSAGTCPDITSFFEGVPVDTVDKQCAGKVALDVVKTLEIIRAALVDIVRFLYSVMMLVFDFVTGVVFSIMTKSNNSGSIGQQMRVAFDSAGLKFVSLLSDLGELFKNLMNMVIDWLKQSSMSGLLDAIKVICQIVTWVLQVIVKILLFLANIPLISTILSVDGLSQYQDMLNAQTCELGSSGCLAGACLIKPIAVNLIASSCGAELFGDAAPVGLFNEFAPAFTCLRSSFCNQQILSFGGADLSAPILCANCAVPEASNALVHYGCELATKQCTCGLAQKPPTPCYHTGDCRTAGAECEIRGDVYSFSDGSRSCLLLEGQASKQGTAFCYKADTRDSLGVCVLFSAYTMSSVAECRKPQLGTSLLHVKRGVCLGTHDVIDSARYMIASHACFLYKCSDNMLYIDNSPVCAAVTEQEAAREFYKAVWSDPRGRLSRRLLEITSSGGGFSRVTSFLHESEDRILDIPADSACREPLRECMRLLVLTAECKLCGAQWLFWNITLQHTKAGVSDVAMLDTRAAAVNLLLSPSTAGAVLVTGPHALLVLLEDWLQNSAAFDRVLWILKASYSELLSLKYKYRPPPGPGPDNSTVQPQPPSTGSPLAMPGRKLLAVQNPEIAAGHPDFSKFTFLNRVSTAQSGTGSLLYKLGVLDIPAGLNCINTGSALVNNVAYDIIRSFERHGWVAKPICQSDSPFEMTCPLVSGMAQQVIDSTAVLLSYYMYMVTQTNCTRNMYVSCLPPANISFVFISDAFPKIRPQNAPAVRRNISLPKSDDIVIDGMLSALSTTLNTLSFTQDAIETTFLGFISMESTYNDTLYYDMKRRNQFSVGVLARDALQCDLDDIMSCRSRNSALPVIILCNLAVISLIVLSLPIPSVFTFFLWSLGMTLGVLYMAYGFSPMCLPRIPTCLGEGLFDMLFTYVIPESLGMPSYLHNASVCDNMLNPVGEGECLLSCAAAPIKIDIASSVFIALDCAIFQKAATATRYMLDLIPPFLKGLVQHDSVLETAAHFEAIFTGTDTELKKAVRVCIGVNAFKIILVACALVFLLPIAIFSIQFVVTLCTSIIVKSASLVVQISQALADSFPM